MRPRVALVGLLVIAGCSSSSPAAHATMSISPASAPFTAPVVVTIHGLPHGADVSVTAQTRDAAGNTWKASATYRSDGSGTVSLGQSPKDAGYTGANPMGLLETLSSSAVDGENTLFYPPIAGARVAFTARIGNRVVATGSTLREYVAPGVQTRALRLASDGVYGRMWTPQGTGRHPAVLAFTGSDGGIADADLVAAQFASRGYPTLALAYFKEPGLPSTLANVPLEYFVRALAVLRAQPDVDTAHVLVAGVSRGGELALLLASRYPSLVDGVFAGVPSSMVFMGYPHGDLPAWTAGGRPVPAVPNVRTTAAEEYADHPAAIIPVERIRGPVVVSCAGQDAEWDSCTFVTQIASRLSAHRFRYPVTVLRYPDAGHFVGFLVPYQPFTTGLLDVVGGSAAPTQAGQLDTTGHVLALLASWR